MSEFLNRLLTESPLLQGGLVLMVTGWLGYQLRAMPANALSLLRLWTTRVVQVRDTHPHYDVWLAMLTEHAVRKGGPRTLEVRTRYNDDGTRGNSASLAAGTDEFWARVQGRWCFVRVYREEGGLGKDLSPRFIIVVEMMMCRRSDVARMVEDVERRAAVAEPLQVVDLYNRYGTCTTLKIPKREAATLCLPAGVFESVELRLREFCAAREQYERAGIPWRFGVLLAGEPGTGKTSLSHALASRLGLRIAVVTLADLESDQELVDVFQSVQDQAIVLIEDVDCAFRKRKGADAEGVSFSGFLNCIDGVMAPHNGRILVMSTNHADRLDPALIRPGRVDLRVDVPLLSRQDASDYADRIFPHVATRHDVVDEVMATERPTPALLINRLTGERWQRPGAGATKVMERSGHAHD